MLRKKERHRCRHNFVKNPYKFAKGIFTESKSGNLECTKQELENHLRCTYSDPKREVEMPEIHGTRRPAEPGIPFNLVDIKKKERWCITSTKREGCKKLGQFRPISLLNIDGKIMFDVITNRVIEFVQKNSFINESIQKAGIPGIPGCVEQIIIIIIIINMLLLSGRQSRMQNNRRKTYQLFGLILLMHMVLYHMR